MLQILPKKQGAAPDKYHTARFQVKPPLPERAEDVIHNRNMKTEHKIFTSGFVESDCRPALGEYLQYDGRYYALTEQRIPYMRDKTLDDRFFILTLFAVAMEAEKQMLNTKDTLLQAALPVGLPPKHYGALYRKFEDYFMDRGVQQFTYRGIPYRIEIMETAAFPQDYAAAMTVYQRIAEFNKVITVDIGGFTLDYLLIRGGKPDLSVCDSLEKGVIRLYNDISSRVNSEQDILIDDTDIDRIIRGEKTDYYGEVIRIVEDMTKTFPVVYRYNYFLIHHNVSSFMLYLLFYTHRLSKSQQPYEKLGDFTYYVHKKGRNPVWKSALDITFYEVCPCFFWSSPCR